MLCARVCVSAYLFACSTEEKSKFGFTPNWIQLASNRFAFFFVIIEIKIVRTPHTKLCVSMQNACPGTQANNNMDLDRVLKRVASTIWLHDDVTCLFVGTNYAIVSSKYCNIKKDIEICWSPFVQLEFLLLYRCHRESATSFQWDINLIG